MKKPLLFIISIILYLNVSGQSVIADFEGAGTSPLFQFFGSTLEGGMTNIIANPDASGINSSSMVSDFTKPVGSEVWAGAFADGTQSAIDLSTDTDICMKVWFNGPGNVALKLENEIDGGPDWIKMADVNQTQEWVEICFNTLETSFEAPFLAAAGGTYTGLVLFFDFGDSPADTDRTYYFDDIVVNEGGSDPADITFSVDMSEYAGSFTSVSVSGTFNMWSGDANPLTDSGNGIWTGVVPAITPGPHEYKFTIDNWTDEEMLNRNDLCTITDANGEFTNRRLNVSTTASTDLVCFNSCYACGDAATLTINLGDAGLTVDPNGFYIAGGAEFGAPGTYRLDDADGDGVHSISMQRPIGFSSHYTFTNGACGDFSCKEDISGQDCADPDAFNDRFLDPLTGDLTITTCFGQCTTDTNCETVPEGNITFQVDMSEYTEAFTQVYLSGTFNNWSGDGAPLTDEGNGIWSTQVPLLYNDYQFKFQLDEWTVQETFADGLDCTAADGTFINRFITVEGDATLCFQWESCTPCGGVNTNNLSQTDDLFQVSPTLVSDFVNIKLNTVYDFDDAQLQVIGLRGENIKSFELNTGTMELDLSELNQGMFFLQLKTNEHIKTQKLIKL